jgi:hypothetical protein
MKRFCKAGGRQVATPDAFFHTISYFIELAMIQVCCPCANVRGIFKEKNALFGTDDVRPCDLCMCNNTGADVEIPALDARGFVHLFCQHPSRGARELDRPAGAPHWLQRS